MKLRYLFASLIAVATLFTSCKDEYEATYLDNTKVSCSYVAIPLGGGSTTVQVTTNDSYTIEVPEKESWLTVTPTTGSAGVATVTFSAESTVDGRECEVLLKSGDETQHINVIQGLSTISSATCAEVINGIENKTYQVTGTCTSIANTTYGNWYMNDGTGELYIYGTVDGAGAYNWTAFNIEVGDEVTVQGPKVTYGGTVELKDAAFVSVTKSLIKVDSISPADGHLTSDGGDVEVFLVNKGNYINVAIPDYAQDWLSMKSVRNGEVIFHATPNTAGPRQATVEFQTEQNNKLYTCQTTISQDGLSGTLAVPFSVQEAIAAANSGITGDYYIKGIVSKVADNGEFGSYGNGTFYISDNGEYYGDNTKDFEAYRCLWLGNQSWAEGNAQIAEGQEVIICGQLTTYNGVAETASKKAYVYSINGVTTDEDGVGSEAYPFGAVGAIASANSGCVNTVYVHGTISKVVSEFSAAYGNGTFWISNDGTYSGDVTKDFEVYRAMWFNAEKWTDGCTQIKEGDDVTVYGLLTVYNGTAETSSGKAWVVNLNGQTE